MILTMVNLILQKIAVIADRGCDYGWISQIADEITEIIALEDRGFSQIPVDTRI